MITFIYSDAYIFFFKYINFKLLRGEELKIGSDTQSNCTALHCYVLMPWGKQLGFWDGISCSPND